MEAVKTAVQPKEAIPVAEGTNPDRPVGTDGDAPIALHEEINGIPYSAVYFEVDSFMNDSDVSFRESAEIIDDAYREKVEGGELADGKSSFDAFVKIAIKATDSQHAPVGVKMAKIAEFVKFMKRINNIDYEQTITSRK